MSCKIHKTSNDFEDLKVAHKQTTFGVEKKYHKQVDMVDTLGKLGFWWLDARVELILSTNGGQQKTGCDRLMRA